MLQIVLVFAELGRSMTAERVRATMISKAGENIAPGFNIQDDEADVVQRIFADYLLLRSVTEVVRGLNADGSKTRGGSTWSAQAVWKILKSPWYCGDYRYNRFRGTVDRIKNSKDEWVITRDHHETIIDRDEWDRVQQIITGNSRYGDGEHKHRPWSSHLFRSLVWCDVCHLRMSRIANRTYADGQTRSVTYWYPDARAGLCENSSAQERQISDFVLSVLRNLVYAKTHFSSIRDLEDLEDTLLSSSVLRDVQSIDAGSVTSLYDTMRRFRTDESYQMAGGQPGRKHREVSPEEETLKRERERLWKAYIRAKDAYTDPDQKRPISPERYQERASDLLSQIEEIDKQRGRLRSESAAIVGSEDVWRAMARLCAVPEIKDARVLQYKKYINSIDKASVRDLLEQVVDSVRVRDGRVTSISLLDGTVIRFTYKRKETEA